ncbi:hypothetical protein FITA111629_05870 [Filibacter tadaridae]|uniref:Tetratricopeptide repeat protein n=1 Tax=Filibacter tadaridae TaxID=2483811 RepID=A0A3P5WI55_9BACL|nr:hypothetical protein [Filibacter tadaridae]VDC19350.1 hypothetical protein FILTAD_00287 [Filibacter tadaridae]
MSKKKPAVFSNVFQWVLLIAGGILLTFILLSFGLQRWIIFIIILVIYISVSAFRPMYIIYKTKSLRSIDRYVARNHKKPIFGYSYALAHGNERDIEESLKRIMNTYKQEDMYDVYGSNLALFQNDPKKLLEHVDNISSQEYKDYYSGFAYVMLGNFDRANEFLGKLRTPWMIHALKAFAALKRGSQEEFRQEADQSVSSAVGMQRYVLHHTLNRFETVGFAKA